MVSPAGETRSAPGPNIHTAIAAIYGEVGYVQKQKTDGLQYRYASESSLIAALRPAMVAQGVYLSVVDYEVMHAETYTTSKGAVMNLVRVRATVRFYHAPSGSWIDVQAIGEGSDSGDKAANKAMTGAYKYALRQTFCIETGDDPDHHSSAEQERASNGNGKVDMKVLSQTLKDMDVPPKEFIAKVVGVYPEDLETIGKAQQYIAEWASENGIEHPAQELIERASKENA